MRIISHRGNINGRDIPNENSISYIDEAINLGFDVEVDVWMVNGMLYLGHDSPDNPISLDWLISRKDKLWVHSKNTDSLDFLHKTDLNFFYHDLDKTTITSKNFFWSQPNIYLKNGITVELNYKNINSVVFGICTDYPILYKNEKNNNF
jgi:hypothetical protein